MTRLEQDPGPEKVERILSDLEDLSWPPATVARQARRIRAHIKGLKNINLNDTVGVKLTTHGLCVMKRNHDDLNASARGALGTFKPPKTDPDGYAYFQLWALMAEFGPHIGMGLPNCFETTMRRGRANG